MTQAETIKWMLGLPDDFAIGFENYHHEGVNQWQTICSALELKAICQRLYDAENVLLAFYDGSDITATHKALKEFLAKYPEDIEETI